MVRDPNPDTPDGELVRDFLAGNSRAFLTLIHRHQPNLLHYARGFLRDQTRAETMCRRVFTRAFSRLSRLKHNSLFSSYAIGILRKELRAIGLKKAPLDLPDTWTALAGLPRVQREVVFYFFQGYPLRTVARLRREAPSHTRVRFTKALAHVARRTIGEEERIATEPGCIRQDQLFLDLVNELAPRDRPGVKEHLTQCAACRERRQRRRELLDTLEGEIAPFNGREPLLREVPGPPRRATLIAAGVVLMIALASFLALRRFFASHMVPVKNPSPAADMRPRP